MALFEKYSTGIISTGVGCSAACSCAGICCSLKSEGRLEGTTITDSCLCSSSLVRESLPAILSYFPL